MSIRKFLKDRWLVAALISPIAIIALSFLINPKTDYNRWDNAEFFTPAIYYSHGLLLGGEFPHLNPHQFLGEPIHAQSSSGALYPPYTLCVVLSRILGLGPERLPLLVLLIHAPFAALGFYLLMRRLGAREAFAYITAIGAVSGGYIHAMTSVWVFMFPIFAWLPWVMLFAARVTDEPSRPSNAVMLAVSLTAVSLVGISQMVVYVWLGAFLFALSYAAAARRIGRLPYMLPPFVLSALLSAPAVLPLYSLVKHTQREGMLGLVEFLSRSVNPESLLGVLNPLYSVSDGFISGDTTLSAYQGAWVPAAILVSLALLVFKRRGGTGDEQGGDDSRLARFLPLMLAATVLMLVLSTGGYGYIYRFTYGIPVWSSFRWPFKILLVALPMLAVAGGAALELASRLADTPRRMRAALALLIGVVILSLAYFFPNQSPKSASLFSAVLIVVGALETLVICAAGRMQGLLALLVFLQAACTVALGHDLGLKTYDEPYAMLEKRLEGEIDKGYRFLPLSRPTRERFQEYLSYWSATMNGLRSATGVYNVLQLRWVASLLPSTEDGALSRDTAPAFLKSHLARGLNIKYVVAAKDDRAALGIIDRAGGLRRILDLGRTYVFEIGDTLPMAYFADNVRRFDKDGFLEGMVLNKAPMRSAYVEADGEPPRTGVVPVGRVLGAEWHENSALIDIDAPGGGFLVVSSAYHPDWRASVDGVEARVYKVNGGIEGVEVPPGGRRVVLAYRPRAFYNGILLALFGAFGLAGWAFYTGRRARASGGPA